MEYIDFSLMLKGLLNSLSGANLVWLFVGTALGLFAGTLPGFSGVSMIAIMMPVFIKLDIDTMLIAISGVYAAAVYSGSICGILYNIPGDATGIATTIEGYKLKQKGRSVEALAGAIGGSFCGSLIGFILLTLIVPIFMYFIFLFGTAERALFAVWALVLISSGAVTKEDPLKGLVSVGMGLILGMVGQQKNVGTLRFTGGLDQLMNGLDLIWVILGLYAIPQLIKMSNLINLKNELEITTEKVTFLGIYRVMFRIIRERLKIISLASLYGIIIGIIPGIGAVTGAWVGYATARKVSKVPEEFNHGSLDGVVGAETANNAAAVGSFIPLLGLGIPGSGVAAIMLGALITVGVYPGPMMMENHGVEVWTIMFGVGLSGIVFTALAFPFIRFALSLSNLPVSILISAIGILVVMGSYITHYSTFGPWIVIILGILTILASPIGVNPVPLFIGFIMGPIIEVDLVRAYQISGFSRFLKPTALAILIFIILTLIIGMYQFYKQKKAKAKEIPTDLPILPLEFVKEKVLAILSLVLISVIFIISSNYPLLARIWVELVLLIFLVIPTIVILTKNISILPQIVAWVKKEGLSEIRSSIKNDSPFNMLMIIASFSLFVSLINIIGFIISSIILVAGITYYFDRKPKTALLYSLLIGFSVFLMKTGLGFNLPIGIWGI